MRIQDNTEMSRMKQEDYIISIFRKDDCKRLIRQELNAISDSATIRDAIDALNSRWASYVCLLDHYPT